MRLIMTSLVLLFSLGTQAAPTPKDWTFLVFLNGHNNLDRFGAEDINEMERVGSTNKINVVVQWATMTHDTTDRLYVTKDNDPNTVTSKAVMKMKRVDMGNVNSLVDFVQWGIKNYPAKHYFIDIWNHGSGWHFQGFDLNDSKLSSGIVINNISWDDNTGNSISTLQLGQAMDKIAAAIGKPVDIYGSDACLMAMPEIAAQMRKSVDYFVGSEEVEPGDGWPYDDFLGEWAKIPSATPEDVARALTHTYVKSYSKGSQGSSDVTFSAFNLKGDRGISFLSSMKDFANAIYTLKPEQKAKVVEVINKTQVFEYSDYGDLIDFLNKLQLKSIDSMDLYRTSEMLKKAALDLVLVNETTAGYANAHGVSIWLPADLATVGTYWQRYQELDFSKITGWGLALKSLYSN